MPRPRQPPIYLRVETDDRDDDHVQQPHDTTTDHPVKPDRDRDVFSCFSSPSCVFVGAMALAFVAGVLFHAIIYASPDVSKARSPGTHDQTVFQAYPGDHHRPDSTDPNEQAPDHADMLSDQTSGQPDQMSGQPDQMSGQPDQMSGQPDQTSGQPGQTSGQPGQTSGQPTQTGKKHNHATPDHALPSSQVVHEAPTNSSQHHPSNQPTEANPDDVPSTDAVASEYEWPDTPFWYEYEHPKNCCAIHKPDYPPECFACLEEKPLNVFCWDAIKKHQEWEANASHMGYRYPERVFENCVALNFTEPMGDWHRPNVGDARKKNKKRRRRRRHEHGV